MNIEERRVMPRTRCAIAARLRISEADAAFFAEIANISMTGVFVRGKVLLPVGYSLQLEILLPNALVPAQATAVVARHFTEIEPPGMGLKLQWVGSETRDLVTRVQGTVS